MIAIGLALERSEQAWVAVTTKGQAIANAYIESAIRESTGVAQE